MSQHASEFRQYKIIQFIPGLFFRSLRYCSSSVQPRIQPSDKEFLKYKFGGVPVILVFTKFDQLRSTIKNDVLSKYIESTGIKGVEEVSELGEPHKSRVNTEREQRLQEKQREQKQEWMNYAPRETTASFVSSKSSRMLEILHVNPSKANVLFGSSNRQGIHQQPEA